MNHISDILNVFLTQDTRGGGRNGVLTAVEDFLAQHPHDYRFCRVRFEYGLGILQLRSGSLLAPAEFGWQRAKAFAYSAKSSLRAALRSS